MVVTILPTAMTVVATVTVINTARVIMSGKLKGKKSILMLAAFNNDQSWLIILPIK